AETRTDPCTVGVGIHAEDLQRAGSARRDAADHPHRRALAGAIRAEEAECLTRGDVEVDRVDRDQLAESLRQLAGVDQRRLLGGGHGIYWDASRRRARQLDFFVAVPGLGAPARTPELVHLDVPFGEELVHYAIGPASCAVPGIPAGLDALWRAHGRLPWQRL